MPGESKSNDGAAALKGQVEQLRHEAALSRKKVSDSAKDLMEYCDKNKAGDTLVSGPSDGHNPFQEKKGCVLI